MYPQPPEPRRSIVEDYALVVIFVSIICFIWIIFNEVVIKVADIAAGYTTSEGAAILNFIVLIWRILPVALIIGIWAWAFMRAFRGREPYQQYGGGY